MSWTRGQLGYHPLMRGLASALRRRCGVDEVNPEDDDEPDREKTERPSAGRRVLVGVSGGADSVALTRALTMLGGHRHWRLSVVVGHVQHHLRGEEAEADARFVAQLAEQLNIEFVRSDVYPQSSDARMAEQANAQAEVDAQTRAHANAQTKAEIDAEAGHGPVPAGAGGELDPREAARGFGQGLGGNLEGRARQLRYEALMRLAEQANAKWIVTAHHGDDQLETLLMRMIRGTGVRGLRGIAWRRVVGNRHLIRPMLGINRGQIHDFLAALGQTWREDRTNQATDRTRARLRAAVTPVLNELQTQAAAHAVSLSDDAAALHEMLDQMAAEAVTRAKRHAAETTSPQSPSNWASGSRSSESSDSSDSLPAFASQLPLDVREGPTCLDRSTLAELAPPVLGQLLREQLIAHGVSADRLSRPRLEALKRAVTDGEGGPGGQRQFGFADDVVVWLTREVLVIGIDAKRSKGEGAKGRVVKGPGDESGNG